jgi:hypothetical protein
MHLEGSCLCGNIHVKVDSAEPTPCLCHCKNCKKVAGSLFTHNLIIKNDEVTITGELTKFVDKMTDSGTPMDRYFCKTCGK